MKKLLSMFIAASTLFMLSACSEKSSDSDEGERPRRGENPEIEKKVGEITIKLFPEIAPVAVQNFIDLAESGYYEGKLMHRIISGFMIQGGSPFGDGMGDPDYDNYFSIEPHPNAIHSYGALSMANAGPDANSQQFFIVNNPAGVSHLNGGYTVFGHTIEGFDMIDAVSSVKTDTDDRPYMDVVIDSVKIKRVEGEPNADSQSEGNVNGNVKLLSGDVYAVITLRITG
ncbi:MAG: peptidylprolyl isomerase [Oscillospiraceae bacterium]|nr:peptidylprolyl isomerase [Oscillospiraceae bacterium]